MPDARVELSKVLPIPPSIFSASTLGALPSLLLLVLKSNGFEQS